MHKHIWAEHSATDPKNTLTKRALAYIHCEIDAIIHPIINTVSFEEISKPREKDHHE